ncbi:PhoX family protein [Haladaptatus salinisoli]|uniref:PhoX family protein n=1 Tax=Haladaptatus salinisoli TaxID=2884876 RepID=UPI001D09A6EF|nr:alkaline phosphatase PhoX [Haladaptatus salinisoli]
MREHLSRRATLESLIAVSLGVHAGTAGARSGRIGGHGKTEPTLNRFATTVAGAEFTGIFLTEDGRLFFNVQHPGAEAEERYRPGAIGAVAGVDMTSLPRDFESVQPPKSPAEYVKTAKGEYQILAEGGDETVNGKRLGVPYSKSGEPLTDGSNPDFNGFVPDGADGGYLFTNWETQPGMMSRLTLERADDAGGWTVAEKRNLDFRPVEGTWNNCFGTVSPWGTPLTSEEYEPDARTWFSSEETTYGNGERAIEEYLGYVGNAYRYGYIVEIENPKGDPKPTKHYAMGRFAHENAVVMPDRKTAYMSDDGTGTVFFKFVADEPGDLSAGTLYAARARQLGPTDDTADVSFGIEWIELAHATDDQVLSWIEEYDDQDPSPNPDYVTDAEVEAWANGDAADDRAAFLESRKAAAAVGATDEFRKMEGVNIKSDARPGDFLYMAMSEVNETMLSNEATGEHDDPQDHIELEGNDYGAVYRMRLDGRYDVHRMEPVVVGGPNANVCGGCPYDSHPNSKSTVCRDCSYNPTRERRSSASRETRGDAKGVHRATEAAKGLAGGGLRRLADASSTVDPENTIANPDNLVILPDGRVVIGEDSDLHRPNMLWVYDPEL